MSITTEALRMLERVSPAAKIVRSVETHLLVDQADAVAPGHSEGRSSSGGSISNPTLTAAIGHGDNGHPSGVLAPYARMERELRAKINAVTKALDALEVECQKVITESAAMLNGKPGHGEPRCPGWSDERRARLGGCGNHLATYRDRNGVDHVRPDYLCFTCIKERNATEREDVA